MNLPEILLHFDNVKKAGNGGYMVSCPMPEHSDSDPSVSIRQDVDTGKIMMFCWGCKKKANELASAAGLRMADLFGDPGHPAAVKILASDIELTDDDIKDMEDYALQTMYKLDLAKDYLEQRFNISTDLAAQLNLGVDPGDASIVRPAGFEAYSGGVPHLVIPFANPDGKLVGMQGRRLIEGEPRWRSKSGSGWSKIGCFGWQLFPEKPIIITEGPSDALAVVGRVGLPALAIRGASLTGDEVTNQIKLWLGDRQAIIIGDNGEAGERFSRELSQKTGIPVWNLPGEYSDVCDYLADGNFLDEAINASDAPSEEKARTPEQTARELQSRIENNLEGCVYDEELKRELVCLTQWQQEAIFNAVLSNAAYGQRGNIQRAVQVLQHAVRAIPPPVRGGGGGDDDGNGINRNPNNLPEIFWNAEDQLQITEHSVREAMDQYEGSDFYQAAPGQYIKVIHEDLVPLKDPGVKSMLSQMGHWRVVNGQRELGHVPNEASKMVCDPSWDCEVPIIKRRVEVPFMLEDGNIISSSGFHEDSGIYLLPRLSDRIVVPEVPAVITEEHVIEAKRILDDVVNGFVFKDEASRTNLIGMTLTSPLRELFKNQPMVPLLTSTAPQSGSGKGTSVRVPLSTCGIGPYSLSTTAYNADENEFEKKLVGKLIKKSTYIFLDNIRAQVNSSVLEQMLTAANYDGRTLGYSEVNSLSTLVLWVCTLQSTGSFNRDLTRRCVPVELIKNHKGTWQHKNIDSYLADMRGQMIWACFVVARKWMQDGAPISQARLDGYGGWTEVIGGILEHVLEMPGFLENLGSFRQTQDEVSMTIDGLLERWLGLYGENEHPARMAIEDFEDPALHQMLGLHNPSTRQVMNALERQLVSQRGHIVGNSHKWEPVGTKNYGHEGPKKLFRCVPLED